MIKTILLFIILNQALAHEEFVCGEDDPRANFSIVEQFFEKIMPKHFGVSEIKFISHNVFDTLRMTYQAKLAYQHSQTFCRPGWLDKASQSVDAGDNEVDAIRHFIFSALLTHRYPDKVLTVLFAHELRGQPFNEQNLMDIKNNQQGMLFAEEVVKKNPHISHETLALMALDKAVELVRSKKLVILKTTAEGFCHNLADKNENEIQKRLNNHAQDFRTTVASAACRNMVTCAVQ